MDNKREAKENNKINNKHRCREENVGKHRHNKPKEIANDEQADEDWGESDKQLDTKTK